MADTCPHCGTPLPIVQDAFCPECRNPLEEDPGQLDEGPAAEGGAGSPVPPFPRRGGNPLTALSGPARLVVIGSLVGTVVGTAVVINWASGSLPAGRYPLWFFAFPVFVLAGLCCAGGLALLNARGVPIFRQDQDDPPEGPSGARPDRD